MINDIKLDGLVPGMNPKKSDTKASETARSAQSADITISNQLKTLVQVLAAHDDIPDESARVSQMKQQIENNNYRVDFDALSEKLVHHLFSKSNGL